MTSTSEVGSEVVSELGSKEGSGQCCKVGSEVGTLNWLKAENFLSHVTLVVHLLTKNSSQEWLNCKKIRMMPNIQKAGQRTPLQATLLGGEWCSTAAWGTTPCGGLRGVLCWFRLAKDSADFIRTSKRSLQTLIPWVGDWLTHKNLCKELLRLYTPWN